MDFIFFNLRECCAGGKPPEKAADSFYHKKAWRTRETKSSSGYTVCHGKFPELYMFRDYATIPMYTYA
jgi:hypothetical protein